jgi:hypothetical protein
MIDIVDRLKFDATRCEAQFSKGVATNISEGAAEIERLRKHKRKQAEDIMTLGQRVGMLEAALRYAKEAIQDGGCDSAAKAVDMARRVLGDEQGARE